MPGEGKSTPSEYEKPGHIPDFVLDDIAGWIRQLRLVATASVGTNPLWRSSRHIIHSLARAVAALDHAASEASRH